MAKEEKPARRPTDAQQMQHPNSLLARTAKDKELRQRFLAWKKDADEVASTYEQAHRRGWV